MFNSLPERSLSNPLTLDEMINFLQKRWGYTYELRILSKGKALYLQIMWGCLEQQSFPLSETEYKERIIKVIEIINRLDQASQVRVWLLNVQGKPRLGKVLSLPLKVDERSKEFVL